MRWDMDNRENKIYGVDVIHSWHDLFFLNCILQHYDFDMVVELGTYNGGLTLFLALNSGAPIHTFDLRGEPQSESYKRLKSILPISHYQLNTLAIYTKNKIEHLTNGRHTLIYCDGGNKADEFNLYTPLLKPRDVIMAHDKGREIFMKDITGAVTDNHLKPFHQDEADEVGADIFSFQKV